MASGDTLNVFTPLANEPPAANYATIDVRNSHPILNHDDTTQEASIFSTVLPRNYAGGGITAYLHWAAATAVTGTVGWDLSFERDNAGGQDLDADNWATPATLGPTTVPGTSGLTAVDSVALANGAPIASIAVGDPYRVRIRRTPATDTAVGDAQLLAVELKET